MEKKGTLLPVFPCLTLLQRRVKGFQDENYSGSCVEWQGMTLGLEEGGDVHRNADASNLIPVKSSSPICNLLQLQEEKKSTLLSVFPCLTLQRGAKWF